MQIKINIVKLKYYNLLIRKKTWIKLSSVLSRFFLIYTKNLLF